MNTKRLFYTIHISFWLLFIGISIWIFSQFLSVNASILRAFFNAIPLATLAYLNIWNVNLNFEEENFKRTIFFSILLFLAFIPIRFYINSIPYLQTNLGLPTNEKTTIIGIVLTNFVFLIFSFLYQVVVNRFKKNKQQSIEIQTFQQAQLQYLRSQINPHFLFNTLNNIYSLTVLKSDKAPKMVLKLSEMLRYVVYEQQNKKVALSKEIQMITTFMDLAKLKYPKDREIIFTIKGNYNNLEIEPMLLIPLVENCFKHSDLEFNRNGFIRISLELDNDNFYFTASNSKNDQQKQKDSVGGVGLENIQTRLKLTYNDNFSFKTEETNQKFTVTLQLKL